MKREDTVYPYKGDWEHEAKCRVRIYELPAYTVVIATELPDNPGTSVSNFAEYLATMICAQYEIRPERLKWIQHYPRRGQHDQFPEEFDLVTFTFHPEAPPQEQPFWDIAYRQSPAQFHFTDPRWRRITMGEVEALIVDSL